MKILTYQNISKEAAIAHAKLHRAKDRLIRGSFYVNRGKNGANWKGCSIGCDVKTTEQPHEKWAWLFGTSIEIAKLIDFLFENLPKPDYLDWHVKVRKAIPVGVDLSSVGPKHAARCLDRCIGYIGAGDETWRVQCRNVVTASRDILATGRWLTQKEAARAARAAMATSSASARWSAMAASAAMAERVDWATRMRNAAGASMAAEVQAQASDLIELLKAAK